MNGRKKNTDWRGEINGNERRGNMYWKRVPCWQPMPRNEGGRRRREWENGLPSMCEGGMA
jgi:hypothetical protein